eukprot:CAMPEP_0194320540 /NCGR_PEP_ID=MMETSP0171-20130528/16844_1 /TAXON_ID=218684 /ORGANISM="Corethron pennatum, Strain L29A3" /LENGTH=553 /DNA_ID=CAMNT_0039078103 /DNA_START=74 /DNA_END=1735 /DNA_ORIENTATION=+
MKMKTSLLHLPGVILIYALPGIMSEDYSAITSTDNYDNSKPDLRAVQSLEGNLRHSVGLEAVDPIASHANNKKGGHSSTWLIDQVMASDNLAQYLSAEKLCEAVDVSGGCVPKKSMKYTNTVRSLANAGPSVECNGILGEFSSSELKKIFTDLVDTLPLPFVTKFFIKIYIGSSVKYGVRGMKICSSCESFAGKWNHNNGGSDYCGEDVYGYNTVVSGAVYYPIDDKTSKIATGDFKGAFLNRPTKFNDFDVPSEQTLGSEVDSYIGLIASSIGSITILPDFLGFGESYKNKKAYIVKESYKTASIPLWFEVNKQVAAMNTQTRLSNEVFVAGYSEGGYASVVIGEALHQMGVKLGFVHASGGPYQFGKTEMAITLAELRESKSPSSKLHLLAMAATMFSSTVPNVSNYGEGQDALETKVRPERAESIKRQVGRGRISERIMPHRGWWKSLNSDIRRYVRRAVKNGTLDKFCQDAPRNVRKLCHAVIEQDVDDIIRSVSEYDLVLCHSKDDEITNIGNIPTNLPERVKVKVVTGLHTEAAILCFIDVFETLLL